MKRQSTKSAIYLLPILLTLIGTAACSGGSNPAAPNSSTTNTNAGDDTKPTVIAVNSVVSVGAVGDVKYSILEPEKFVKENGEGWVLMQGQDIKGTDLWKLTGIETLPDARGVFIRGANIKRKPEEGDPDVNRQIGSYQADSFKKHSHPVGPLNLGWNIEGNGGPHRIETDDGAGSWANYDVKQTAEDVGGDETRPRNINLYTYIKVSNPTYKPAAEPSR